MSVVMEEEIRQQERVNVKRVGHILHGHAGHVAQTHGRGPEYARCNAG